MAEINAGIDPDVTEVRPRASIIVPTYGRRDMVCQVLQSLSVQAVSPDAFEVVVVCDGDIDGSARACRAIRDRVRFVLRVIEQANQGRAAARNAGVEVARGELLIFLDDDILVDKGF